MGIIDLFSKRQKRLRDEMPDVYQYTEIPQTLRVQIVHIIEEVVSTDSDVFYKPIHKTLCKE
jgi:polyhydroxyalkanoate synthesis regulator protein